MHCHQLIGTGIKSKEWSRTGWANSPATMLPSLLENTTYSQARYKKDKASHVNR